MSKLFAILVSTAAVIMGGSLIVGFWMMALRMMMDLPSTLILVPLSVLLSLLIVGLVTDFLLTRIQSL